MAPLRANVVIYIEGPILPLNVLQTSQLIAKNVVVLEIEDDWAKWCMLKNANKTIVEMEEKDVEEVENLNLNTYLK